MTPQRYLMIGAGGTGTHLLDPALRYLRSYHGNTDPGVWQFGVMDGDTVEVHNMDRQLFQPNTIQQNKAEAAVLPHNHMNNVVAIPEYLGMDNIARFLTDGITIFIAADNFPVRGLIEKYCLTLKNCTVINGGNEDSWGTCQIWIRKDGVDLTPPLSFMHPEINEPGPDRAAMTCAQIAALPGGGQLIVANMASAMHMLTALIDSHREVLAWTESRFDLFDHKGNFMVDNRDLRGWNGADA